WNTISLNTLPKNLFERNVGGNPDLVTASDIFPWMAKTRVSDFKAGKDTTPLDVNPLQTFWATPRRIRLKVEEDTQALCDLCHEASRKIIRTYVTKNYGINYVGHWNHFLTPHYRDKDSVLHPRHASSKGITYRDWLGLIVNDQEKGYEAAYRIRQFLESDYCEDKQLRLWAFGFDMDNMKAKCWYEGVMPIVTVSINIREKYENETMRLVKSAQAVGANLTSAIKKSWFTRTSEIKSDPSNVDRLFWIRTESIFYNSLNLLKEALEKKEPNEGVLRAWHKKITSQALDIFDETVLSGQFEQEDTKRMVKARNELIKFNWSKKIMEQILELPTKHK
ncbi:MAG: type I-E CRISPR-associated protein Cse1/CasA, partial [Desulfomonilaceae bacterium]